MDITFQQAIVFLPLITALTTLFLTSLFTIYREKKNNSFAKQIFFEYAEYELDYSFIKTAKHGEGRLLLGENGNKIYDAATKHNEAIYTYLVLKNATDNNAINVKIKSVNSGSIEDLSSKKIVTEEFFIALWNSKDILYIPTSIYNSSSHLSTNEELVITYFITTLEKFRYSFVRQKDGSYKEQLKKGYLGFIWIPKINYHKGNFYRFVKVEKKV